MDEIKDAYHESTKRMATINEELRNIEDNGIRLENVRQALEIIDKYKDISDKWDTKLFGKAKFHNQYQDEKWQYNNSVRSLKEYGVKDKLDYINQQHSHDSNAEVVGSKLEAEKVKITPIINVIEHAVQSVNNVLRAEKYQQHKNLELTKGSKHRNMEDGLGYER
jgi:hypothetical protein